MTNELLATVRSQAERSPLPIRAAAQLRLARVESASDPGHARITFEIALDAIRSLREPDRRMFLEQARQVAAAIAPDLLSELPALGRSPNNHQAETLLSIMVQHGHIDAAFDFILGCDTPFGFPFGFAANLMQKLDPVRRIAVLRSAIEAWRVPEDVELPGGLRIQHEDGNGSAMRLYQLQNQFLCLFQHHWNLLPSEEALAVVRESVRTALDRSDLGTSAGYPDGIHFTSSREHVLFEVLHILRHLDPSLAESLIVGHAQLAIASQRYPNGMETMHEEAERQAKEHRKQMGLSGETCGGGVVMGGDSRDFPRQMSLHQSSQSGDFGPSVDYALELYREDSDPERLNQAPKTFWPSTTNLRTTLYNVGKKLGPSAAALLDFVPDVDLRLFATIEFAAALAGLPPFPETSMKQRRRPAMEGIPMRAPDGSGIRCPKCLWVPIQEALWSCKCRQVWNTFDTRGLCPACRYQWEITVCPSCGEVSAHAAWYPNE